MPDHPRAVLYSVIVSNLVHSGDWRAHVERLREMRGYGTEYPEAADLLEQRGREWEASIAEARPEPARRTA